MLRISTIETRSQRKLVLEGTLIRPWIEEVERAFCSASENLADRKLVIDLTNVTVISQEGENLLLELIRGGTKFFCEGVFTRHVLKRLGKKCEMTV